MQLSTIKGFLFDLDGTLLDTAPDLINALNYVLEQHGLAPSDAEEARAQVSHGATALLKLGFKHAYEQHDPLTLRHELLNFYYNNLACETTLFSGYQSLLEAFQKNHIPWGIVTNKPAFLTYPLIQQMEDKVPILTTSQCLIAADSFITRKPFSMGVLKGAAALKVAPHTAAYIGDSIRDIEAGNYANMYTIATQYGYVGPDDDLTTWNADKIINHPEELLESI